MFNGIKVVSLKYEKIYDFGSSCQWPSAVVALESAEQSNRRANLKIQENYLYYVTSSPECIYILSYFGATRQNSYTLFITTDNQSSISFDDDKLKNICYKYL